MTVVMKTFGIQTLSLFLLGEQLSPRRWGIELEWWTFGRLCDASVLGLTLFHSVAPDAVLVNRVTQTLLERPATCSCLTRRCHTHWEGTRNTHHARAPTGNFSNLKMEHTQCLEEQVPSLNGMVWAGALIRSGNESLSS